MSNGRNRRRAGQSTLELVAGLVVLVPIVLFGIDISTLFFGSSLNTQVCRDAARSAASGPPSAISAGQPQQRAMAVVQRGANTQGAIRLRTNASDVIVTENIQSLPDAQFGGLVTGTVTVQTTCDVYPPFMLGHIMGKQSFPMTTTQTFPFTYVVPSVYTASLPSTSGGNGGGSTGAGGNTGGGTGGNTGGGSGGNAGGPTSSAMGLGGNTGGSSGPSPSFSGGNTGGASGSSPSSSFQ